MGSARDEHSVGDGFELAAGRSFSRPLPTDDIE